ncbi:uncharacterized protein LOC120422436 isoform X3 [Culex pipiens pallens]|uniref:uncharacterized protein LOC120422436 isoform X3 n=1 Tax=Culex pipiens pallens TaxID=42434 RepID=UPI00195414EE|nr:uncharacterized protein LOC120422436 isoform X3 [Culex pipiens pallens]XP_039441802.1 uncharacterized protein LOC120422436 isoform X3 [Culex pipiens pallens]XP_039441803.1 uncharacterized protein LOC120422436 isoform X3 [Culex pipiens pallens]
MLSHKIYKLLCYLAAIANIALVLEIIVNVALPARSRVATDLLISPCMANIVLAVLLIMGVAKRMPSFIRVFLIFMYVQIVFLLLVAVYTYRLVVHGRHELRMAAHGACMLIALFGLEAMIASGGLKAVLLEYTPLQEGTVMFQPLV